MALPTAGTGAEQDQFWPLPKFYFSVDIGDMTDLPFQEVSGLEVETEMIEYRHGICTRYIRCTRCRLDCGLFCPRDLHHVSSVCGCAGVDTDCDPSSVENVSPHEGKYIPHLGISGKPGRLLYIF